MSEGQISTADKFKYQFNILLTFNSVIQESTPLKAVRYWSLNVKE